MIWLSSVHPFVPRNVWREYQHSDNKWRSRRWVMRTAPLQSYHTTDFWGRKSKSSPDAQAPPVEPLRKMNPSAIARVTKWGHLTLILAFLKVKAQHFQE
jgi:hypothetical protein